MTSSGVSLVRLSEFFHNISFYYLLTTLLAAKSSVSSVCQVTLHSSGVVTGGRVTTYLLEKTRVARQLEDERSYHVFYQLCQGADEEMRARLGLKHASEFRSLVSYNTFSLLRRQVHILTITCLCDIHI